MACNYGSPHCPEKHGITLRPRDHWSVSVERNGENLVTIETNMLSGKPDFTPEEEDTIRAAGETLLAFIGLPGPAEPIGDAAAAAGAESTAALTTTDRLAWTLDNIYTIARRETARTVADERADRMFRHVLRLCEQVGCRPRGVLRDNCGAV